jgi:hypothetical protein
MQYSLNKIKNNGVTDDLTYIVLKDTKIKSHNRNERGILTESHNIEIHYESTSISRKDAGRAP